MIPAPSKQFCVKLNKYVSLEQFIWENTASRFNRPVSLGVHTVTPPFEAAVKLQDSLR